MFVYYVYYTIGKSDDPTSTLFLSKTRQNNIKPCKPFLKL